MSTVFLANYKEPLTAVLIERRKVEQRANPDIEMYDHVLLKSGPQAYKLAVHWVIRDRNTGEVHHHAVKIETWRRTKKSGWQWDKEHTITLDDQDGDETIRLATFLGGVHGVTIPTEPGHYLVMPVADQRVNVESMRQLLAELSAGGKVDAIAEVLKAANDDPEVLRALYESVAENPDAAKSAAAALTVARYAAAVAELEALIAADVPERRFQAFFERNDWMFGSEYSALLDRRNWTRDEQQDFMLRRTVDDYLELVEIKTPLPKKPLFVYDPDHKTHYPRVELSKVIGQVMHYLEQLDRSDDRIRARDNENVTKLRAKIIIGRDGEEAQTEALCRLNGHLHRIEVLTFDQLVRIARRILSYLEGAMAGTGLPEAALLDDDSIDDVSF